MAEAPIPYKSLARRIEARDALKRPPAVALTKTMFLPGDKPKVEVSNVEAVRPLFEGERMFKVEVDVGRFAVGRHSFPPAWRAPSSSGDASSSWRTTIATRSRAFSRTTSP